MNILHNADIVYLEQFTSPAGESDLKEAAQITGSETRLVQAKRWQVEDGKQILSDAQTKAVVLLSYGDPYVATTHIELRTRAIQQGIQTRTIHGSSSITSVVGECGLHHYKMGRMATIMDERSSLTTPYYTIYRNVIEGSHTMLLLEYNQDKDFFLDPRNAFEMLLETEKGQKRRVVVPSTFAIVASRIGLENKTIVSGSIKSLLERASGFGEPPHTIIIPGSLHFTESDALKALGTCIDGPSDNHDMTIKIPAQMLQKYVPMVRDAIVEVAPHCADQNDLKYILENAELYVRDAERFLQDGQDEVAVLSIGYADGLVDALRLAKGLDPKM